MNDFSGLRLLYIGSSGYSGNGLDKRRAIESLGVDLASFDTQRYLRFASRVVNSLAHRANVGPAVTALNRDLLDFAEMVPAADVIWVDKGQWLWPETLESLKLRFGARAVHYANDSMLHVNRSRHFRRSVPLYDVLFTTKTWEMEGYRRLGAQVVHHVFDAVDDTRFQPREVSPEQEADFGSDVTFIGRCEPYYVSCVRAIAETGVDLRIWGPGWPRHARRNAWARKRVRGAGVWHDEYPVALSAARIGLGLLSKLFPENHTTRTFEIPACGTFLLAERTPAHQELYEEGREAEFFDGEGEMLEKLGHYLRHPEERERIAAAGHARYERSGYNRRARYREMLALTLAAPALQDQAS